MSKRNRRWFKIYDALAPFVMSQGDCELATDLVVQALATKGSK